MIPLSTGPAPLLYAGAPAFPEGTVQVGHVHILVLRLRLRLCLIGTREHPTPPNERRANLPRSGSEIDSDKVLFEDVVLVRPNPIQPSPPWSAAGYASFGHTYLYNDIWV